MSKYNGVGVEAVASEIGVLTKDDQESITEKSLINGLITRFGVSETEARKAIKEARPFLKEQVIKLEKLRSELNARLAETNPSSLDLIENFASLSCSSEIIFEELKECGLKKEDVDKSFLLLKTS